MKDARKLVLTYDTRSSPLSGTKMKRKKNEREIEYLSTRNARVEEKRKNNGRKDRRSSKVYTRRIGGLRRKLYGMERERSGERNDRDKARRRRKRERVKRGMHAGATKTETRDRTRCSSGEVS